MHHAGLARTDISLFEPGMAMFGWGLATHQAQRVDTPLHARALVLRDDAGGTVAVVVVELLVVTLGLWREVIHALQTEHPALGLHAGNTAIVATHTHSGPSGYSHHFWLHLNAPGFSARVHDGLRDAIVDVIVAAHADLAPARLVLASAEVPRDAGVAFNRSWFAYNRNRDVAPVPASRRDEAVDRALTLVRVERPDGRVVGVLDWFGLHNTCIHGDKDGLHSDHKGLAAATLEARHGVVALMAQECCGDVTPNHRPAPHRGHTVGLHDDDHASACAVADAQVAVIERLLTAPGEVLDGPIAAVTELVDFRGATADAAFTIDGAEHSTGTGTIGLAMALGTAEGPGPLWPARRAVAVVHAVGRWVSRAVGRAPHDPRIPLVDLERGARGRVLGLIPVRHLPALDPMFAWIRRQVRAGTADTGPWMPPVVPVQLLRVGQLVVLTTPHEPTTVAGRRLRATLLAHAPEGVTRAVISPYANAYLGYLTTAEEYQVQHYEAAYTLHGPHALAALQTVAAALAGRLAEGSSVRGDLPARTDRAALERIAFVEAWPV